LDISRSLSRAEMTIAELSLLYAGAPPNEAEASLQA